MELKNIDDITNCRNILDNLFDGVYCVDRERKIIYWNKSSERITGYSAKEVMGKCCVDNILRHIDENGNELCSNSCPLHATMEDRVTRRANVYLHHKAGHRVSVAVKSIPIETATGEVVGAVEIFQNKTGRDELIAQMEKLRDESLLDNLTNVGNRRMGETILRSMISDLGNNEVPFGLIFMDLDHFKNINDTYGHDAGDQVLVMVTKTVANLLRPHDTIARWGGEEFIIIIANTDFKLLSSIAERIRKFIEKSWLTIEEQNLRVTVTMGARMAKPGEDLDALVKKTDALMYEGKNTGRNKVVLEESREN